MKVEIVPIEATDFLGTLFSAERDAVRSPGLHLSQILNAIEEDLGKAQYAQPETAEDEQQRQTYFAAGFLWEHVAADYLNKVGLEVDRIGEVELDGIYLTPDGILHTDPWSLEEWKCTWKSAKKDLERDFERWLWQTQAYAYALSQITGKWMLNATIRVFFVNGYYDVLTGKGQFNKPCIRFWNLTFTERELTENWQMIVNTARSRGWLKKDGRSGS